MERGTWGKQDGLSFLFYLHHFTLSFAFQTHFICFAVLFAFFFFVPFCHPSKLLWHSATPSLITFTNYSWPTIFMDPVSGRGTEWPEPNTSQTARGWSVTEGCMCCRGAGAGSGADGPGTELVPRGARCMPSPNCPACLCSCWCSTFWRGWGGAPQLAGWCWRSLGHCFHQGLPGICTESSTWWTTGIESITFSLYPLSLSLSPSYPSHPQYQNTLQFLSLLFFSSPVSYHLASFIIFPLFDFRKDAQWKKLFAVTTFEVPCMWFRVTLWSWFSFK